MLVAQITDTHITTPGTLLSDIIDTAAALERAVEALNRLVVPAGVFIKIKA